MIRINAIMTICVLVHFTLIHGCDIMTPPVKTIEPPASRVYFNSFESQGDTIGWKGLMEFRADAPPLGGKHSVLISGGCIYPHAYYDLPVSQEDNYLIVKCFGKNLSNGGGIELDLSDNDAHHHIVIGITDTIWRSYQSRDTLYCPRNTRLRLSMSSGGIVPSSMLVDLLEVLKVN